MSLIFDAWQNPAILLWYYDNKVILIILTFVSDIAIGAYKSNRAFIIKTLSVIDYKLTLESNVTSISSSSMNITFCVYYSQRSPTRNFKTLQFGIELELDYRVPGATHFTYSLSPNISQTLCSSLTVTVQVIGLSLCYFWFAFISEIMASLIYDE